MSSRPPANTLRIAVVEDEKDYRELLALWFGERYVVDCFPDGQEFMKALRRDVHFDLIISDISMPGMSGLELLAQVRSHPELAQVPALAISAHFSEGDRERVLAAGFREFVNKSAGFDELDAVIRRALESKTLSAGNI